MNIKIIWERQKSNLPSDSFKSISFITHRLTNGQSLSNKSSKYQKKYFVEIKFQIIIKRIGLFLIISSFNIPLVCISIRKLILKKLEQNFLILN